MFILGSQIPTFPNRAWLTWKSTDAFFILQLILQDGAEAAEEFGRSAGFLFAAAAAVVVF